MICCKQACHTRILCIRPTPSPRIVRSTPTRPAMDGEAALDAAAAQKMAVQSEQLGVDPWTDAMRISSQAL